MSSTYKTYFIDLLLSPIASALVFKATYIRGGFRLQLLTPWRQSNKSTSITLFCRLVNRWRKHYWNHHITQPHKPPPSASLNSLLCRQQTANCPPDRYELINSWIRPWYLHQAILCGYLVMTRKDQWGTCHYVVRAVENREFICRMKLHLEIDQDSKSAASSSQRIEQRRVVWLRHLWCHHRGELAT